MPKKTQHSTNWAVNAFTTWLEDRNKIENIEKCPTNILLTQEPTILNKWLKIFIIEVRKVNSDPYPPKTLYMMLSGILRYMRSVKPDCPNILSKENHFFTDLHNTVDGVFRKLRAQGVGANPKHTQPFNKEEENLLRGGEEHRNLKITVY